MSGRGRGEINYASEEEGTARLREPYYNSSSLIARVYQVWPGNNTFFCGGRIMMGPGPTSCLVTLTIILAPSSIFYASTIQSLAEHNQDANAVEWFTGCMLVWLLYTFWRTAVCDPGVIPRRAGYDDPRLKKLLPPSQGVVYNGRVVTLKYCITCNIYRPPRCSHCKICDNCVDKFDHHCPWVGNCIGRRNYRWFLLFTFSSAFFAVVVSATCVYAMLLEGGGGGAGAVAWGRAIVAGAHALPGTVSVLVLCCLSLLFTGTLSFFHAYLASINMTTAEKMKGMAGNGPWAHSRGCSQNWRDLIWEPTPPSMVDPRLEVALDASPVDHNPLFNLQSPTYTSPSSSLRLPFTSGSGSDSPAEDRAPALAHLPRV